MCLNLLVQFEVSIVYRRVCSSFRAREDEDLTGGDILSFDSAMQLVLPFSLQLPGRVHSERASKLAPAFLPCMARHDRIHLK